MSLASSPKRTLDRGPCIAIKAEEPCTATAYNQKGHTDCNEPSPKRIRSSTASGLRRSPNKWTKEENQKLTALVAHYGEKKWKRISADLGGFKTGAQCAQHWKRVLSPDIRKGHWDEIEEELLLRLVIQYGSCWKKIAKKIPQRTDIQCRYQYLKAKQSREVPWDPKEDDVLIKKVVEMANCSASKFSSDSNDKASSANDNSLIGASSTAVPSCYTNSHIFAEKENNVHGYSCVNGDSATNPGWNSNLGFYSELHRVVWLEVAEHMARMKLTSSLRTALECKTRFTELLGTTFNSANQEEETHKCFGLKGSGNAFVSSNPLFTTLPSINPHVNNDNSRVTDTTNNNTININISNNSDKNNNNITITNNTFSHNITINITNTHNPFNPNPSLHTTNNTQPLTKPEPNLKPSHKETPPTLPLPNFHTVVQPLIADTKQTQGIVVMSFLSGLDSLATVASTLPHEMLVSDASSPTCKATNLS